MYNNYRNENRLTEPKISFFFLTLVLHTINIIPMITQNKSIYEIIGEKERGIPFQVKNLSEALKTASTDELEALIDNFEDLKFQAKERLQTLRDNNQNNEYRKTYGEKIAEEYQKYEGLLKTEAQQDKENRSREH